MARRWLGVMGFSVVLVGCGDDTHQSNMNVNDNGICGNGRVDGAEECDQGELSSDTAPDHCRTDCRLPRCGDGVVDPANNELCDCGDGSGTLPDPHCSGPNSDDPGSTCSTRCHVPVCGDGLVEGGETCEATDLQGATCENKGFTGGTIDCFNCRLWLEGCVDGCGNRVLEGDEACDGPDLGGKQCTDVGFQWGDLACLPACELDLSGCEYGCGNGRRESAEQCDGADLAFGDCSLLGFAGGTLACADDCTYDFTGCLGGCGNGIVETAEVCDDANQQPWDGCSACAITELRVNACVDCNADQPAVAMASDGRFVVAWSEADGNGYRLLARQYPAAGAPPGPEILVSSSQMDTLDQVAVAMAADGRFVLVWRAAAGDSSGSGVFLRRYAPDGSALAPEAQVNTNVSGGQQAPAVAMAGDGRFVVVWQGPDIDGNGDGISAQRFDASGTPQGAELLVNTGTTNNQTTPAVAMGSDGRFVVVWATTDWQASGFGIFAQRFDAAGAPQGAELLVNETSTADSRTSPAVAMGSDYRFVVAWTGGNADGDDAAVVARRFDASGAPLAGELVANTITAGPQVAPSVAMAGDGRFVVAWQSPVQGGYYYGTEVMGQRYDADGQAQGTEFQANVFTDHEQQWPAAAMAGDGRFVVVWRSAGQEGSGGGPNVYAQRYAADGTARGVLP